MQDPRPSPSTPGTELGDKPKWLLWTQWVRVSKNTQAKKSQNLRTCQLGWNFSGWEQFSWTHVQTNNKTSSLFLCFDDEVHVCGVAFSATSKHCFQKQFHIKLHFPWPVVQQRGRLTSPEGFLVFSLCRRLSSSESNFFLATDHAFSPICFKCIRIIRVRTLSM